MSSPIHHAEDLDEALHYAPPWAREQGLREPLRPAAALVRSPPSRWRIGVADDAFSGDRAMVKLQRQLALDPDAVPEPPVDDIQSLWPMALRLCGVAGVAAAVAWLVISLPGTRLLRHDVVHADIQVPPPAADPQKQDPLRSPAAAGLLLQHGLAEATAAPSPAEAMPAAAPPAVSAPPSSDAAVTQIVSLPLDSDEIAMLLKRGKDALSTGDLASARLVVSARGRGGQRGSGAGARRHVRSAGHPPPRRDRRRAGRRTGAAMVPKSRRARLDHGFAAAGPARSGGAIALTPERGDGRRRRASGRNATAGTSAPSPATFPARSPIPTCPRAGSATAASASSSRRPTGRSDRAPGRRSRSMSADAGNESRRAATASADRF